MPSDLLLHMFIALQPNVLIDGDGHARLADFGLALLAIQTATESSLASGTARYMAPELHRPEQYGLNHSRPTKASDIYSLGCLICEVPHSFPSCVVYRFSVFQ